MLHYGLGFWIVTGIGALLGLVAQLFVKTTFSKYSKRPTSSGMTGADVARRILADSGIHDVQVERVAGHLSDHYDPRSKTLRLSEPVYASRSMAAFGVAAHEVGHAIQHARGMALLGFRSWWVPVANLGGKLSIYILFAAMILGGAQSALGYNLGWLGVGLFGATTLFTLVTVPVEIDASRRAMVALADGGYTTVEERAGARKVLTAAAMTYVAAFIASAMQLVYWAMRLGLIGGRRN